MKQIAIALKRTKEERGFVAVMFALAAFVLILMAGFAVDLGSWYLTAARLQRASDAAALAGAMALPNNAQATAAISTSYSSNGISNGGNISTTQTITPDAVETTVTNKAVPTYFLRLIMNSISISRSSTAAYGSLSPALGSPFNALGTGDLSIPGIPKQNFWLAINGVCDPAEDGDLFDARWDANKEGISNVTGLATTPFAQTDCGDGVAAPNPAVQTSGYTYFVDVPSVQAGGSVAIQVYNGSANNNPGTPDRILALPGDPGDQGVDTGFIVSDTNGTPNNKADDTVLLQAMETSEDGTRADSEEDWMTLATVTQPGLYSIQVFPDPGIFDPHGELQIHAFSLMAKRSWGTTGCDSRGPDKSCPRVYAGAAESVYNNVPASGSTDFYFAQLAPAFAGSDITAYLWDPGEGVDQIQFVGPDGNPISFDWTATPPCSPNASSGTNTQALLTGGTCIDNPARPNLSNQDTFNDRLVTATVHIPDNYASMVATAGGDDYIRLRYTVSGTPSDRTTWGVTLPGGINGIPHLVSQ